MSRGAQVIAAVALVGALAGSSAAVAAEPTVVFAPYVAAASKVAPPAPPSVEDIARDEIAQLAALGYQVDLVTWNFVPTQDHLGTGYATWPRTVTIDTTIADWAMFDGNLETVVRSTVRHEYGHTVIYSLGNQVNDPAMRAFCPDPIEDRFVEPGSNLGQECMADAISLVLSQQRGEPRFAFYGLTNLLDTSVAHARPLLAPFRSTEQAGSPVGRDAPTGSAAQG